MTSQLSSVVLALLPLCVRSDGAAGSTAGTIVFWVMVAFCCCLPCVVAAFASHLIRMYHQQRMTNQGNSSAAPTVNVAVPAFQSYPEESPLQTASAAPTFLPPPYYPTAAKPDSPPDYETAVGSQCNRPEQDVNHNDSFDCDRSLDNSTAAVTSNSTACNDGV